MQVYGAEEEIWTPTSLRSPPPQDGVSTIPPPRPKLAGVAGFEPATGGFGDRCSTNWATLLASG